MCLQKTTTEYTAKGCICYGPQGFIRSQMYCGEEISLNMPCFLHIYSTTLYNENDLYFCPDKLSISINDSWQLWHQLRHSCYDSYDRSDGLNHTDF